MYSSNRVARLRNALVAISSGSITLVILLIAPLGLAAVIVNTLLVTVATYAASSMGDKIAGWLEPSRGKQTFSSRIERQIKDFRDKM